MEKLLQYWIEHCTKEMRFIEEQLPNGLAKPDEYHKMCGKHYAYMEMRTKMGDMLTRMINGSDEE